MTVERMAEAILELTGNMAGPLGLELELPPREELRPKIIRDLQANDEDALSLADLVERVVNAYMGGGVERHGRALIEAIAETNKAKRLCMNVLTGPGAGSWECIIRRDRTQQMPAIILPGSKEWN